MKPTRSSARAALRGVEAMYGTLRAGLDDGVRVARFVRGALAFRPRPDDIFIASYPRSGTTWLQYVVHVLVHDGDTGFTHISDVVPWYERSLALGHRRAIDYERMPSPRIFKSHLPYAWLPRGARYIYARRDGRDVVVSYHQLYRSHLGDESDFERFFQRFLHGCVQYGSWFEHVAAWATHAHKPNVRVVDYEALIRDLEGEMNALCRFLGLARSPRRVHELALACGFEAMKRAESRFDHASGPAARPAIHSGAFVRMGQSGAYANVLTEAQLAQFAVALAQRPRRPRLSRLHAFLH